MKEFLSCVREFDVRVRHKLLNSNAKKQGTEAWWLKPNYMSLFNLLSMMFLLGPLVEYWDGGGKGERFIQVVKPHIKRGVRDDLDCFFVNLLDKIYRGMQLDLLEVLYGVAPGNKLSDFDLMDILRGLVEVVEEDDTTTQEADRSSDEDEGDSPANNVEDDACFSTSETLGMTKKRTIYVYRKKEQLLEAYSKKKPIAGYVEVSQGDGGESVFEFRAVYRKPVKLLARQKICFDDAKGVTYHGMWCAPIDMDTENVQCTDSFSTIQAEAKLAAVAIPLLYVLGKEHPHASKYCVITNWWKYRMRDGRYRLPALDESLYGGEYSHLESNNDHSSGTPTVKTRFVNGIQLGEI